MQTSILQRATAPCVAVFALILVALNQDSAHAQYDGQPINMKVSTGSQRLEMIVNSSRILTLDEKIPRAQVNNPEVLELQPLSPTQVQVFAKKPGVTQVNLWDQNNNVKSIDVIIYGDARELSMLLQSQFPTASLKVVPLANSVVVSGYVDRPEQVSSVVRIAEDYYPKVINNITVGGVQQVLLHVKVMEVSRTKLRTLGFDFAIDSGNFSLVSSVSGLLSPAGAALSADTLRFGITDSTNFLGVLEALRKNNLMKVLAEPTLVTVSGRPASFKVGGEFPIIVPQSLGTVSIEYKSFGTQVDFVPIVLGNGRVRLEVRPRVSEIDSTRGVTINETTVPGLRVREVDTGVEMTAGQTLALAGLVQTRIEAENKGFPVLAELPFFGIPFRRVTDTMNEIELLILVTPELVSAMDAHQVPPIGPGETTVRPDNHELYWKGHLEVPNCAIQGIGPGGPVPVGPPIESVPPGSVPATGIPAGPPMPNARVPLPYHSSSMGKYPAAVTSYQAKTSRLPRVAPTNHAEVRYNPVVPKVSRTLTSTEAASAFIGPVGYDVRK